MKLIRYKICFQSWPYFLIFMVLEHIVLRLKGKNGIRLNDGLTSISHGIFQECGRFVTLFVIQN